MAASTKEARRLGRNDMANTREVLINLVSENKRKVLKPVALDVMRVNPLTNRQRLAQKGRGPFETLPGRLDTRVRPSGGKELPKSFIVR